MARDNIRVFPPVEWYFFWVNVTPQEVNVIHGLNYLVESPIVKLNFVLNGSHSWYYVEVTTALHYLVEVIHSIRWEAPIGFPISVGSIIAFARVTHGPFTA